jgi:hypothetical protein
MEPHDSLSCSHEPSIGPHHERSVSSPCTQIVFILILIFNVVTFQVLVAAIIKIIAFWVIQSCSLEVDSTHLWNVGLLHWDYTALYPRWLPSSILILFSQSVPMSPRESSIRFSDYNIQCSHGFCACDMTGPCIYTILLNFITLIIVDKEEKLFRSSECIFSSF